MSKQEFVDRLRMALSGRVSASLVEENVTYYEDYINTQTRMGNSEESVIASLGDPRLIAKSIITANDSTASAETGDARDYAYNENYYVERGRDSSVRVKGIPGWLWLLIIILIIVLAIGTVFSLVYALLPVIIPVLIVLFFVKLFRDWLN